MAKAGKRLVREIVGGEPYDYYPLGKYVVAAPGVCRGRPTFKYTRIEVEGVLDLMAAGESMKQLVENFRGRVPKAAIEEALRLAASLLKREAKAVLVRFNVPSSKFQVQKSPKSESNNEVTVQ